jgi:hypothetical protein
MPATPVKGGAVPQSDKVKTSRKLSGPTVLKGGTVPSEVLEDSRPSSKAEILPNPVTKQEVKVVQADQPSSPPSPDPATSSPSPKSKKADKASQDYSGWNLLGLEMDSHDPLYQWEIRSHPTTGEVVKVPVGKAAEDKVGPTTPGATPTSGNDSLPPEAGLPGPSTSSNPA